MLRCHLALLRRALSSGPALEQRLAASLKAQPASRQAVQLVAAATADGAASSLASGSSGPAGGATTAAGMVVTRRAAAVQAAEECRLERVVSNLQASCSAAPVGPPVSSKFAAVLVPLFEDPASGEVHVVLNQRSSRLKTHSGEVCFPGGKRDPGDADDVATALREAQEELGLDPAAVRIVACLPPFLSKHLLSVTPVVAVIPPHLSFTPNPSEVDSVFTAPLRRFLEAGPGYSSRDVEWQPGLQYRLHYFEYLAHSGQSYTIWGLTAGMLIVVAEKAFGRRPDFLPNPPGALPYTALAVGEDGQLVFRQQGAAPLAGGRDALSLAGEAAAEEGPRSAAQQGAVVTEQEVQAALGGGDGDGSISSGNEFPGGGGEAGGGGGGWGATARKRSAR